MNMNKNEIPPQTPKGAMSELAPEVTFFRRPLGILSCCFKYVYAPITFIAPLGVWGEQKIMQNQKQ